MQEEDPDDSTGSDEPGGLRQDVRAEGGFAYGVIGADIHVFGDGMPLYLLENWRPVPETDAQWLREQPSRMLNSRFAVVDFTGREDELAQLHQWRETGPRLAARWLHGPGGQGKSRLAAQFAAESAAAGWKVVTATHGPGSVIPPPGSQDMRLDNTAGLLMIVDYADRWPQTHLTWLLSNALLHQSAVRTRVLLLARTADPWPALRATLTNQQVGASTQFLEPLSPDDSGQRAEMFDAARDSFARHYGVDALAGIAPPGPLDDPDFGLTLAVHMAALVAVDAHVTGRRPPADMAGLTIYLLDREQAHWARLYGDATHELNPTERTYTTPPGVMNQTVFTAALTGPLEHAAGTAVLTTLQLQLPPQQVLADHAVCYPPASPVGGATLEPLYPDRLAEDFLALTLPGHTADYPAQAWASAATTTLLTRNTDHTPPTWTPRTITFLAAAAERWPHVAQQYLNPLLLNDPQLALAAGSAALTALASLEDIGSDTLITVGAHFPQERHRDLDPGMAAVTARITPYLLAEIDDPGYHAQVHHHLGVRLSAVGRWGEAVEAASEAVAIRRRLAESSPTVHEPDLALSLHNLAASLSDIGRWGEAVEAASEAVAIRRRLAEGNPTVHEPYLGLALTNLSGHLATVRRQKQAVVTQQEAVAIFRRLAESSPTMYEPDLAHSLHNLGAAFAKVGRWGEAVEAASEAVAIRRRLAEGNPTAHEPDLASSLINLGASLSGSGQRKEEALTATQEAVAVFRRLVAGNASGYEPDLALSLHNLAASLSDAGRRREAAEVAREVVALYRRLAEAYPAAYEPDLASSLTNLAVSLSEVGQRDSALKALNEVVAIHRRLRQAKPSAYGSSIVPSVKNISGQLRALRRAVKGMVLYWRLRRSQVQQAGFDRGALEGDNEAT
ncbi:tetratricopeptide repeat protein [Streptomyces sp. NPDC058746]|uniref:tetratricopeptide repeat protein n=1 Tax=Streptomyces sp. NPDC058746 TaxID=3346622 RepID=UPI003690E241